MVDGDDLFGNGVNVAARMEGLAEAGGICVSGNVQEHIGSSLDVALEDLGEQSVKNIERPVRCYRVHLEPDGNTNAPPPISDKPAVAVLPFENMSGDPEQEYFADGLTEDIITALSLWRSFPVIARNSTFAYKGASPDIRKVGTELGARYVIEGSVRKVSERVRISAQLIDSETGHHLYQLFEYQVRCYRVHLEPDGNTNAPPPISDKPAVAVLPFENMSGDPEQEYFADGLTEDIITALSLWRSFPVIARNSTFAYKGASPDIRKVGTELGARYVIEGSVRKVSERVRISAQLIDSETGHHLWAEKYDRRLEDIFELQDEITSRISATVEPQMALAERDRLHAQRTHDLNAWDYYQRGSAYLHRLTAESNRFAQEAFEKAIQIDPDYSQAYFGLGYCHHRDIYLDVAEDREESLRLTFELTRRAIALDDSNSDAHCLMAIANIWAHNYKEAIAAAEQGLQLNPSNARVLFTKGAALHFSGRSKEAIPVFELGFALNPRDPNCDIYLSFMAGAHLNLGKHEEAEEFARQALQHQPENFDAQLIFVSSLGHLGRTEEAQDTNMSCAKKVCG